MSQSSAQYVLLGTIVKPHGYQGSFLVRTDAGQSSALGYVSTLFLKHAENYQPYSVVESAWMPKGWKITLQGVAEESAAQALRDQGIFAERAELKALESNEFYVSDLEGCRVVDADSGETVGTLAAVEDLRTDTRIGHALWNIALPSKKILAVPATSHFIARVDATKREIYVRHLDSLGKGNTK